MINDRQKLSTLRGELDPSRRIDVATLIKGAEEAIVEDRLDDADAILSGVLVVDPGSSTAWRLVGRLAEERGELDEAERAYRTAMELGQDESAVLALARLLISIARFDEGEALLSWIALDGESISLRRTADELLTAIEKRRGRLS
ncbi:MAG: hypothetical protein HYV07_01355 [Deltaproteobacteria bacterium]|nr:hypothetical protein [Deltaproteobacteria bacterium]